MAPLLRFFGIEMLTFKFWIQSASGLLGVLVRARVQGAGCLGIGFRALGFGG